LYCNCDVVPYILINTFFLDLDLFENTQTHIQV
jgi:hypothetical protein